MEQAENDKKPRPKEFWSWLETQIWRDDDVGAISRWLDHLQAWARPVETNRAVILEELERLRVSTTPQYFDPAKSFCEEAGARAWQEYRMFLSGQAATPWIDENKALLEYRLRQKITEQTSKENMAAAVNEYIADKTNGQEPPT